jgi:hypothetical protein
VHFIEWAIRLYTFGYQKVMDFFFPSRAGIYGVPFSVHEHCFRQSFATSVT